MFVSFLTKSYHERRTPISLGWSYIHDCLQDDIKKNNCSRRIISTASFVLGGDTSTSSWASDSSSETPSLWLKIPARIDSSDGISLTVTLLSVATKSSKENAFGIRPAFRKRSYTLFESVTSCTSGVSQSVAFCRTKFACRKQLEIVPLETEFHDFLSSRNAVSKSMLKSLLVS